MSQPRPSPVFGSKTFFFKIIFCIRPTSSNLPDLLRSHSPQIPSVSICAFLIGKNESSKSIVYVHFICFHRSWILNEPSHWRHLIALFEGLWVTLGQKSLKGSILTFSFTRQCISQLLFWPWTGLAVRIESDRHQSRCSFKCLENGPLQWLSRGEYSKPFT